jgi:leucyl aminopeptidase
MIWLGTGTGEDLALRDAAATTAQQLPEGKYRFEDDNDELVIGWLLGQYQFDRYKSNGSKINKLLVSSDQHERLCMVVNGLFLARDLINTPTNDMGPAELAEVTKEIAIEYGANFAQCVDQELLEKGYRTIYTVGQAAENRPRLIELTWGDESAPKLTLVGKGVCFDSGGLDIKPAAGMRIMKKDMGGAAHALGLAVMIMAAKLKVRLRVLLPAVENSISSNAFRPGDIIKTYKGTTVEIDNTDAEGRLVLCDALTLAGEEQPELILDFATLTGAARVAMGPDVVPYFTDDESIASELQQSSDNTNDPVWRLPLFKGYESDLKSTVADMSNMGKGPFGGAITAALYLKHFVPADIPWVHFDLYGWNLGRKPTCPEGGQSMAIQAVFAMLQNRYAQS